MQIGILTFHRALNYGAVLQAYALSETLNQEEGIDAEIVDYRCQFIEDCYKPLAIVGPHNIKNFIIAVLTMPSRIARRKKFDNFLEKNLRKSDVVYSKDMLSSSNSKYDFFVTGSDQVFNNVCAGMDTAYFLDFVESDRKKNSYAASFGFDQIPSGLTEQYKSLLKSFNRLSVREEVGKKIIQDLLHRDAFVNIDPVFLLSADKWRQISQKPVQNNYILVYLLQPSESIIEFVRNLASKTGCTPLLMHLHFFKNNGITQISTASPEEFLGYFANAKYVVTNSFHGTAFSVIFHKQFFVEYQTTAAARNSRQKNLLEMVQLTDRVIDQTTANDLLENRDKLIDFSVADQKIEEEVKKSKQFFSGFNNLEEPKNE